MALHTIGRKLTEIYILSLKITYISCYTQHNIYLKFLPYGTVFYFDTETFFHPSAAFKVP